MMERMPIVLTLLILTAYLFNIGSARRCDSQDGQSSIECDDSDICCEVNGDVDCCTAAQLWWVWVLIGVFVIGTIISCICCCYCIRKHACKTI